MGPLLGRVDEPSPGDALLRGPTTVRGWAAWGERPAVAVAARVNGELVAQAAVGSERRPDVAAAFNNPLLCGSGWTLTVDLARVVGDSAEIRIAVWPELFSFATELEPIEICVTDHDQEPTEEPEPVFEGALDLPRPSDVVLPTAFQLMGWALYPSSPIDRLDVVLDRQFHGRARLGVSRPDVAQAFDQPWAAISGFEYTVDDLETKLGRRKVDVQLVAHRPGRDPEVVLERSIALGVRAWGPDKGDRGAVLEARRNRIAARRREARDLELVVFTHHLGYGGGQLWLHEMLKRSGAGSAFGCRVISFGDGPLRDALEQVGVEVHVSSPAPADCLEAYEGRITELTAIVAASGANAALVNTVTAFPGADVCVRMGLPLVWGIHESLTPKAYFALSYGSDGDPRILAILENTLGASAALVFEAEATRRIYEPWAGRGRSVVVPYGIDTQSVIDYCTKNAKVEAKREMGFRDGSRVVLVMGTIEPRKSQTIIASAFQQIFERHPAWTVVFVGDLHNQHSRGLEEYTRRAGIADRVRIEPVVADTYRWYRCADLLMSASDMESLPRSVLEAMCFGVPVLATSVFGLPELIVDGQTGLLFEPNDLAACIGAMDDALSLAPEALDAVGRAGQHHVITKCDSRGYVEGLMALIRGLRDRPAALPGDILVTAGRANRSGDPELGP